MKVFLAGGVRLAPDALDWRDVVMTWGPPGTEYMEPSKDEFYWWTENLKRIHQADVVFVYIAANNPSGYGAMFEAGYASAIGKHLILVVDPKFPGAKYFNTAGMVADLWVETLDQGIRQLAFTEQWLKTEAARAKLREEMEQCR